MNEELKKAKSYIAELNLDLEQKIVLRTAQLEVANKELESFSYSVSHDLRAPLRAINGFAQVLIEDCIEQFDDEARTLLGEIIGNSKKMGELIDNLLEFSRISKKQVSIVEVCINEMIETIIMELRQKEPARNIKVVVKNADNIKGDRNMLKQVFINLISNAFKYTGKNEVAEIEIGSYKEGNFCTYYVKDNGAGFDMLYYDKLFGVFQRLHNSFEFEGTGIGLSIVHRIISKHGGKVWAEGKSTKELAFISHCHFN